MWLARQISQGKGLQIRRGLVSGEEAVDIQGESEYRAPEQVLPYGVSSRACQGDRAVMLGCYCAGVPCGPDGRLEPGEVRLYSAGGAEILLRRDGAVVINGQEFPRP